jgi:hypothetical protein
VIDPNALLVLAGLAGLGLVFLLAVLDILQRRP